MYPHGETRITLWPERVLPEGEEHHRFRASTRHVHEIIRHDADHAELFAVRVKAPPHHIRGWRQNSSK
jgi:hypothetical protein